MKIMLWKLGHIDQGNTLNSILPSDEMLEKFRTILANSLKGSDGEGVLSIVWGPDIDVKLIEIDGDIKHYVAGKDGKLVKVCDQ